VWGGLELKSRKLAEHWQSLHGQRKANSFPINPSVRKAGELLSLSRKQLRRSNIIRKLMDNIKLLLICILLLSHSFNSLGSIFINVYMVLFLFNTVIYVFI
jgi:hypothetical protein